MKKSINQYGRFILENKFCWIIPIIFLYGILCWWLPSLVERLLH